MTKFFARRGLKGRVYMRLYIPARALVPSLPARGERAGERGFLPRRTAALKNFVLHPKIEPNDVDIFLLMDDSFDVRQVSPEASLVFDHTAAQNLLGASVFWIRREAALGGEEATIAHWQLKRDGRKRGIVEVVGHD